MLSFLWKLKLFILRKIKLHKKTLQNIQHISTSTVTKFIRALQCLLVASLYASPNKTINVFRGNNLQVKMNTNLVRTTETKENASINASRQAQSKSIKMKRNFIR